MTSGRRTGQLHLNRVSGSDTVYFVTCCTHWRISRLLEPEIAAAIHTSVRQSDAIRDTATFAFTIMPDHCHWVFRLGARLSLGRIVARFKADTRKVLAPRRAEWQRDFYEHRLLHGEQPEDYAFYVFLNPYRAGLIRPDEAWPHWWTAIPEALRFVSLLNPNGSPQTEWIGEAVPPSVRHGE